LLAPLPMNSPTARSSHKPVIVVIILSTFVAFFLYDVAESLWLKEASPGTLHLLHEARAVLTCLIIAGATIAAAIQRRPTPFPSAELTAKSWQESPLVHLADWFLWMRWLACASAAILILVTIEISHLLPAVLLLPLLGCVAFLAVSNVVFTRLLAFSPGTVARQVAFQVLADLGTLSVLLHFSGGIENPLSLLYLFHVIISGILFTRKWCYLVAFFAFAMFGLMAAFEYFDLISHYTLEIFPHADSHGSGEEVLHAAHYGPYVTSRILLQGLILMITGYFITTIMERLRRREQDARDLAISESEARERLESVVDAAGAGLRLLDSSLTPTWTNAKFLQWEPDEELALSAARLTLQDGLTRSTEHQVPQPDGSHRYYATTTAAMIGENEQPHHVVQLVQDISERKSAEAEAIHIGKLAAVGELAGNLAHEINNPLGILTARIHLLLRSREQLPEKATEDLQTMGSLVDRISGITRSMLGHVRPSNRERKSMHIQPLLEHAGLLSESYASRKNVHITFDIAGQSPAVLASAGELEQILVNLLLNAVDASPSGGTVRVEAVGAKLESGKEVLRVSVEDEGPGVPESIRPRIFEAFFSTKKTGEGTGLGLSLSLRIAKDHGGIIRVEQGAVGARFVMDIPAHSVVDA
jgi:signal transduction histidine kinase